MSRRVSTIISLFISIVILVMVYFGILYYEKGEGESSKRIEVVIPAGSTLSDVVDTLSTHGVLKKTRLFKVSAILTGRDKSIKAGRYIFRGNESVAEVLRKLSRGEVSYKRLIVPEGLYISEIASLVSAELGVDSAMFYERALDKSVLAKYKIPAPSLEGYLFPDTYLFEWPVSADEVIERMVGRFLEIYHMYIRELADSAGMSMNEVVTLASIIQAEAQYSSEMARISAVYHNRLKLHWRLEADPTVAYALGGVRRSLTYRDLRVDSPYNTYRRKGLPPGPICNPGLKALMAAVKPASDCRDLYFVADGTGRHIFSRTLAEHLRAKRGVRRGKFSEGVRDSLKGNELMKGEGYKDKAVNSGS